MVPVSPERSLAVMKRDNWLIRALALSLLLAMSMALFANLVFAQKLTKAEVDDLTAKGDSQRVVTLLEHRGVDFEPTEEYIESLRSKGVRPEVLNALRLVGTSPMTKSEIITLLKSDAADKALAAAVRRRGLNFRPSDDDLEDFRVAGGGDLLDAELQRTRQTIPPPSPPGSAADRVTGAQQGAQSIVQDGSAGVTAPVPTYQPAPPYSLKAARAKVSGVVTLAVVIDAHGDVTDVEVVKGLGYGLDENAVRTVKTWKFQPAERAGVPVKVRVSVKVSFAYDEQHIPTDCWMR